MAVRTLSCSFKTLLAGAVPQGSIATLYLEEADQTGSYTTAISNTAQTTDANGDCSFANLVPSVDGSQNRTYRISLRDFNTQQELVNESFQMPDANASLHNLIDAVTLDSGRFAYKDADEQTFEGINHFTGTLTAVTQSQNNNSTKVATTAYVDTLNGLNNELSEILGNGNTTGSNDIEVTSGRKIKTNTIDETTAAAGVTIETVLVKDGQVDGRDVSADGTKLDGIEANATADQTDAQIRAAVEAASDSNVFTDADHSKLDGIAASANNYVHPNHSGDVTSSSDGATTIANDAVTYAKIQDISATNRILGRDSSGAGVVEEISPADVRTMLNVEDGATADQTNAEIKAAVEAASDSNVFTDADHAKLNGVASSANNYSHPIQSGDVTSSGDGATVIANDAVTYAKMQDVSATDRVLGRDSSGSGVIEEIAPADLRTMLNVEDGATADQTNAEIKAAVEAASDSNVFTDADHSKLNAIEASADVTDATNVAAAGAAMDTDFSANGVMERTGAGSYTTRKNHSTTSAPTANDDSADGFSVGSVWYDTNNNLAYVALDVSSAAAVWKNMTADSGTGDLVSTNNLNDVANAGTARTNLGLAIGSNVQAFDAVLDDLSALSVVATDEFIVGTGTGAYGNRTPSQVRTTLNVSDGANNYSHPNHTGDVTSSADGATTIAADAVTYAKMQNVSATNRILGRDSSGAGIVEEIAPADIRTMLNVADGANAYVHPNHTGDVTSSADGATTIANDAVTYAKMQDVSTTDRLLGRDSSGSGVVEEIAPSAIRTMINVADGANAYVHPNHSGEVTSTADGATVIASNIVDEDNLKISNAGSNGQYLQKQSGDTGGLTWADVAAGLTLVAVQTSTFTAAAGNQYLCNTTGGAFNINLPAGTAGDTIGIIDYLGTFDTNNLTLVQSGSEKIFRVDANGTIDTKNWSTSIKYMDATVGWLPAGD